MTADSHVSHDTSPEFLVIQENLAGRYSLVREIGRGGMGVVYLAQEVRLDRLVALKVLPPEYSARPGLRERFLREARTAARLSHPNIVPIHAVDEVAEFVFFAMAYVEGQTLGERLRARGPVPPREAARLLREVAWALAYAHANGVVHRDVKPDNILLEDGSGRALVTDFGIAQVSGGTGALTDASEVLGTAEFMSPEQASGEAVDERSDVYSLGVVAHYVLSGRLPFEGPTVAAVLAKHITQPAPPLATVAPEVPRPLAAAVDRCLAKDPAERFPDGEALAEALSRHEEVRLEVPPPIRLFMKQGEDSANALATLVLLTVLFVSMAALGPLTGAPSWVSVFQAVLGAAFTVAPIGMLGHMVRRLVRSGYGWEDVVAVLRREVEERRGDLATAYGEGPDLVERWARIVGGGALALIFAGMAWMIFAPPLVANPALEQGLVIVTIILLPMTATVAGLLAAVRHQIRGKVPGAGWLRIWGSRPGRWFFNLASSGLRRLPGAASGYRPTEAILGTAADRLFEELPRDVRRDFPELPEVVRSLERHAERMRARMGGLDQLLEEADGAGTESRAVAEELRDARAVAAERLSEAVRALESIRLQLLRLHAGEGSVDGLTADLGSARELAERFEHLVEGRREVEELLGGTPAPREPRASPTPV